MRDEIIEIDESGKVHMPFDDRRYDLAKVFAEALLRAREVQRLRDRSSAVNPKAVAKEAVSHADALIEELAK